MRKAGGVLTIIGGTGVIMSEWLGVVSKLPLSGAIGAPLILFGILGIIFIALRKGEFR